jgi:hypothetical protein
MAKKPSKKTRPAAVKKGVPKRRPKKNIPPPAPVEQRIEPIHQDSNGLPLVEGLLLVVAGVLALPNFRILLMGSFLDHYKFLPYVAIVAGFFLLFRAFRRQSPVPPLPELSRPMAYLGFAFFYALCFYTRFCHPETPEPTFWNDDRVVYYDIRAIIDFGINHLLFPFGQREPFFPYFTSFLWRLMPNSDGVFVDRLSSTLIDMGTCWGFYRLGRELAGRWLGLFLMALYSVGKPMVIYAYFGYGANTCMLSTVWMTYFFLQLMKNPVFKRFIYLGIAMGFGAFTYVPARPWTPFLIGIIWLWILWTTREKPKSRSQWLLLIGGMALWSFLAIYKNGFLPETLGWVGFLTRIPVYAILFAILLAAYFKAGFKSKSDDTSRVVFGWATMALIALLVNIPFYLQPGYASHVVQSSALHVDGKMSLGLTALGKLLGNVVFYFGMMFTESDRNGTIYPMSMDSFFDPLPVAGVAIGLAFFLAKPSWRKVFILSLIPVGMVPFILAEMPNSARPLTSVIPWLVLAGWGFVYWIQSFVAAVPQKFFRLLAFAGLAVFWAWNGVKSDWSIWHLWMTNVSNDAFIFRQVDKDWKKYRVLVACHKDQFCSEAFTTLCDQRDVTEWSGPTPLYLEPGETGKDVALLFWGADPRKIGEQVRREFPEAQISNVPAFYYPGEQRNTGTYQDDPQFMQRALIPASAVEKKISGMIYSVRVPSGYWRRRFYDEGYIWARGLVWWDDRVVNLSASFPKEAALCESARADGELNVSTEGDYVFSGTYGLDFIILLVDGKKIMDYYPETGKNDLPHASIHLTPGVHSVSLEAYLQYNLAFPKVSVKPPTGPEFTLGE